MSIKRPSLSLHQRGEVVAKNPPQQLYDPLLVELLLIRGDHGFEGGIVVKQVVDAKRDGVHILLPVFDPAPGLQLAQQAVDRRILQLGQGVGQDRAQYCDAEDDQIPAGPLHEGRGLDLEFDLIAQQHVLAGQLERQGIRGRLLEPDGHALLAAVVPDPYAADQAVANLPQLVRK